MLKRSLLAVLLFLSVTGFGQTDHYLSGRACIADGLYDSALFHLEKALQQNPGKTELYYQLGIAYFTLKDYPAARDAFYETEKRRKGMGSFYLAKSEIRLNHPQQALKYLRIHLSSRYKKSESEILLDEEISTLDGLPGWQQLWNEKRWYTTRDKEFQDAMFLKSQGDYLEAINQLNNLEKQGYKRSVVQSEKAAIYQELGNMKASRSALKAAVKSDVRNLDALQQLAAVQAAEGDAEEAIEGLNRVIRQEPARFEAYIQRAEARSQADDLAGALSDMELYLTYFPENDSALYRQGLIQFQHRKYLDAIQSFNKSLALNRGEAAYYFARGRTYAVTGTTRYAEKDMSMALDLDPLNGEIWYEKGKLADQLGNGNSACHCYRKAFQYGIFEAGELISKRCN
ncbi:MAG: tetratricopeptide repeat protein [Bacteroidales bacterium]|nr:tetratricopeptide repeat protein [Bacteroidales bacterium]